LITCSCDAKEVLSNGIRGFGLTICASVEYLVDRFSLYPEAQKRENKKENDK
jgi:hypothetical protein